jgi:hypothetical protein
MTKGESAGGTFCALEQKWNRQATANLGGGQGVGLATLWPWLPDTGPGWGGRLMTNLMTNCQVGLRKMPAKLASQIATGGGESDGLAKRLEQAHLLRLF